MGSPETALIWRDVVGKRWISCALWQASISSVLWVVWEILLNLSSQPSSDTESHFLFSFLWTTTRFVLFQACQISFLFGQSFVLEKEETDPALAGDFWNHVRKWVWQVLGISDKCSPSDISEMKKTIRNRVDYITFSVLCILSGALAFLALLSGLNSNVGPNILDLSLRGATLGLAYAYLLSYKRNLSLSLPIIHRRLYFSFKMGIPRAVKTSSKLALSLLPLGEIVTRAVAYRSRVMNVGTLRDALWWQPLFAAGIFGTVLCWELSGHLIQVFHTKRHEFAPPLASPSAEEHPTELLLMVLEDKETSALVLYHAFLDLCSVSETHVDTWRRAAFFEETGDTYRRLINVCLKRLDDFTARLAQNLEVREAEEGMNPLTPPEDPPESGSGPFDFQICILCARIVASLTTSSRSEDKYGVSQLNRCNGDVVSSLLSCLLVLEIFLGRSSAKGNTFVSNSVNWTVSDRFAVFDTKKGIKQYNPFRKRTIPHKKAYCLADVVRTSLYQIVNTFSEEMALAGTGGKDDLVAMRDWVSQKKPLFGTNEMHVQKLTAFAPSQSG